MKFIGQHTRYVFAFDGAGRPSIFDNGEVANQPATRLEFGDARMLCARMRHVLHDARDAGEHGVAEFAGCRFAELHDAISAWLRASQGKAA